jgi:hypothetical protein
MLDRNPLDPLAGVLVPGAPKESLVGLDNCRLATIVTSCGRATTIFLSCPNRKLSLTTSSV